MSDFLTIISDKRRLKAQLKTLDESQLSDVKHKFDSAFGDVFAIHEAERKEQAEKRRKVADFLAQAERENISIDELINGIEPKRATRKKLPPKYEFIDEAGNVKTWTGQGRMPIALKLEVEKGAALNDFLIKPQSEG